MEKERTGARIAHRAQTRYSTKIKVSFRRTTTSSCRRRTTTASSSSTNEDPLRTTEHTRKVPLRRLRPYIHKSQQTSQFPPFKL